MELQGESRIAAPREAVWIALNDPEILRQCIPGCEAIEQVGENQLAATVVSRIGPIKARFSGKVTLSDFDPPSAYTIAGEGNGGVAGVVQGRARVRLAEEDGQTLLHYDTEAQINGKIAQIGARMIDLFVKKMAAEFFSRFGDIVAQRADAG